jgi:hypothetical protein
MFRAKKRYTCVANMTTGCIQAPHFIVEVQWQLKTQAGAVDEQRSTLSHRIPGFRRLQDELSAESATISHVLSQLHSYSIVRQQETSATKHHVNATAQEDA